jgi:hypothetical protein
MKKLMVLAMSLIMLPLAAVAHARPGAVLNLVGTYTGKGNLESVSTAPAFSDNLTITLNITEQTDRFFVGTFKVVNADPSLDFTIPIAGRVSKNLEVSMAGDSFLSHGKLVAAGKQVAEGVFRIPGPGASEALPIGIGTYILLKQ